MTVAGYTAGALVGASLAGIIAIGVVTSDNEPAVGDELTPSRRLVQEVNRVRGRHHLMRVVYSLRQSRGARVWSRHLAHTGVLAHDSARRAGPGDWRREAVGWRWPRSTPRQAVGQWLASPAHRAILLDSGVDAIGAGRARGRLGDYWTLRAR